MTEIWGDTEKIIYIISNTKGEIPRNEVIEFAKPISNRIEELLNTESVELDDEETIKAFLKKAQNTRYFGINFRNIGESKNTIELRLANGTVDANTWIENINLFGGLIKVSQDLAIIQAKKEEDRTDEENKKLEYFEKIQSKEISEKEKAEALLNLIVSDEIRDIYMERYETNSELIKQNTKIEEGITKEIATKPLKVKDVGMRIFLGPRAVTGQEYSHSSEIIERDMENNIDFRGFV